MSVKNSVYESASLAPGSSILVYAFFILSGICGLVYEVVWDRYLLTFVGVSTYAHTVVLTTFMGGLALGSLLFGRLATGSFNGLRLYGWLEVGIGMYAVLFPHLFTSLGDLYVILARPFYPHVAGLTMARFLLCMALLLPPTVLMGGTLPVLTQFLTGERVHLRRNVSLLYAANSAGAVLGTYLGGFWLIRELGFAMTLVSVGFANVLLGFAAVFLSRTLRPQGSAPREEETQSPDSFLYSPAEARTAGWMAALSGAITMGLEVTWVRYWGLVLGSSTYSFTLMLMAFISGIALGSLIVAGRFGRRNLASLLFWTFFGTAAILLLGLPFYDRVPYWFARLRLWFGNTHGSYLAYQFCVYLGCFLMMFIPTTLSGMVLPLTIRIASRAAGRLGRDVGRIYALNTLGTLAGSMLCGLVLLSWIGLEATFRLLFAFYLAAAAFLWFRGEKRQVWPLAALAALAGLHFSYYQPWDQLVLNQGLYRPGQADFVPQGETWKQYLKILSKAGVRVLEIHEGHSASVAILQYTQGQRSMHINGKVDASLGDETSQQMTGHLPLLAHPRPQTGLVIGLGSGSTAAALEAHDLKRVDVVELHPEVIAGSRAFEAYTGGVLSRPGVNLFVDDALHFLRVSTVRYDVIASEPTNPWQAGVGNLFTREYYQLLSTHLEPGGIVSQWIPTYEISDEVVAMLLRTVASVFPYVELFQTKPYDLILLAAHQPIRPQLSRIEKCLRRPRVKENLRKLAIDSPAAVAALHQTSAGDLREMLSRGPLNRLDDPLVEFLAPEPFFRQVCSVLQDKLDTRFVPRPVTGLWWKQLFGDRAATPAELKSIHQSAHHSGNHRLVWAISRAEMLTTPSEDLSDDLRIRRWREALPGEACRLMPRGGKAKVSLLAAAYQEEKRLFWETYSVFFRPNADCPTFLVRKLLEIDADRRLVWQRAWGVWLWVQGDQRESARMLREWFTSRPAGRWEEEEVLALRILIRGLMDTNQGEELLLPLHTLGKIQRWPEDFLVYSRGKDFLEKARRPLR